VLRLLFGLLFAIALVPGDLRAQDWPARPIKFIVSQAAGGTPDLICRLITERLSRTLGQQVVVENRPGGGNIVGAQAAARAAPDGYTFFFATAAALVTNPFTFKSLPYDPAKDFTPVAMIASNPFFLLAHPGLGAKTLPELIALDKAKPGTISAATDGQRNFSGMVTAWLNKAAGTGIVQVPYATMPQGVQDALAGRVQLVVLAIPSSAPLIERGALRPLAVTSAKRLPGFETIPPVADTLPGFDFIGWFAVVAPAGTPAPILARMNREIDAALNDPDIAKRLRDVGMFTEGAGTPQSTGAYIAAQLEIWRRIVREIGLQPE
jgi:tripartite-type tricarboxylate transporter receptor subunit TctC